VGEIKNILLQTMKMVRTTVTFYDSQNKIIGSVFTFTTPSMMDPGSHATYEIVISKNDLASTYVAYIKSVYEWQ
jgi:hypothetical protein